MIKLIIYSVLMLAIKVLADTSKFRWSRTWFSAISWLDAWKNAPSPFDLWHFLMGCLYTGFAADLMWQVGIRGWSLALWIVAWWVLFFGLFNFIYHYAAILPEFRDWKIFKKMRDEFYREWRIWR